jgi:16S rRNA (cytidine1402-2'-O)-methyltransferase
VAAIQVRLAGRAKSITPIRQWYNKRRRFMSGTLFVVATPIGNLEDITLRALRVLREVAIIAAEDTRRTAHLLSRHAISTPTTSLHEHNESKKSAALVARLLRGENVALVSDAGTPTVSDPGGELIRSALDAGIRIEPLPGPSAVIAALAVSGFPTDTFTFLGFPPSRASARTGWFDHARDAGGTIVFFEAPHRIHRTLEDLRAHVGDCPVVVAREMTKAHEELVRGPISVVLSSLAAGRGEYTVIAHLADVLLNDRNMPVPGAVELHIEFGELTAVRGLSRREAIAGLARKHGMSRNAVYAAIESVKQSGE